MDFFIEINVYMLFCFVSNRILFIKKLYMCFLSYMLSNWQVSGCDRYKYKMFQSLFGSLLNHLITTPINIFW